MGYKMNFKALASSIFLISSLSLTVLIPVSAQAAPYFPTTSEATKAATKIGYVKTGFFSSGQAVYQATKSTPSGSIKGLTYISPDADSHNGGAWKASKSVIGLGSKATRLGTYNVNLTVRIGD